MGEMRDHQWEDPGAGFADEASDSSATAADGYALDDDAVASVIAHASRLIASSLQPIGRGLFAGANAAAPDCGDLVRMAIQIDAVTALHRRLSRPRPHDVPIEDHCRALCCDLILALGRLDITPRVAMCDAALSAAHSFRVSVLVVELMAYAMGRHAAPRPDAAIWATLEPASDGRLDLCVADNFGPPGARAPPWPPRVAALMAALQGELVSSADSAGAVRVRFPVG